MKRVTAERFQPRAFTWRSTGATFTIMATPAEERLTQRELRNDSGRVLRDVAAGRSFVVTNRGTPVGRLVPVDGAAESSLPLRPARRTGGWRAAAGEPRSGTRPIAEVLDELREDRL